MNLKCLFGHKWNGCKCERCGKLSADAIKRIEKVKLALKNWYKESAGQRVGSGICDDCGKKNLFAGHCYLRPGGYLCCEMCADRILGSEYIEWDEALSNLNRFFGPGLPQKIVDMEIK